VCYLVLKCSAQLYRPVVHNLEAAACDCNAANTGSGRLGGKAVHFFRVREREVEVYLLGHNAS
jgi:hypothetical protein